MWTMTATFGWSLRLVSSRGLVWLANRFRMTRRLALGTALTGRVGNPLVL